MDRKIRMRNAGTFLLFGGPSVIAFLAVVVIPFIVGLYLTFTNWDVRTGDNTFIGLSNYVAVWQDKVFWTQLWFTLKYVFLPLLSQTPLLFIALALTGGGRGEQWLRTGFSHLI